MSPVGAPPGVGHTVARGGTWWHSTAPAPAPAQSTRGSRAPGYLELAPFTCCCPQVPMHPVPRGGVSPRTQLGHRPHSPGPQLSRARAEGLGCTRQRGDARLPSPGDCVGPWVSSHRQPRRGRPLPHTARAAPVLLIRTAARGPAAPTGPSLVWTHQGAPRVPSTLASHPPPARRYRPRSLPAPAPLGASGGKGLLSHPGSPEGPPRTRGEQRPRRGTGKSLFSSCTRLPAAQRPRLSPQRQK